MEEMCFEEDQGIGNLFLAVPCLQWYARAVLGDMAKLKHNGINEKELIQASNEPTISSE